jgi:hypothetical protein
MEVAGPSSTHGYRLIATRMQALGQSIAFIRKAHVCRVAENRLNW